MVIISEQILLKPNDTLDSSPKSPLYPDITVEEYLTYAAHLRLMEEKQIPHAVEQAMKRCDITHFRERIINNLSGGYQQRVGIAQAIVHNPRFCRS